MQTAIGFLVNALIAELPSIKGVPESLAKLKTPLIAIRNAINELYPGS